MTFIETSPAQPGSSATAYECGKFTGEATDNEPTISDCDWSAWKHHMFWLLLQCLVTVLLTHRLLQSR